MVDVQATLGHHEVKRSVGKDVELDDGGDDTEDRKCHQIADKGSNCDATAETQARNGRHGCALSDCHDTQTTSIRASPIWTAFSPDTSVKDRRGDAFAGRSTH